MAQIKQKKSFHEEVAEKLIEQLKQGTAPWQKKWDQGEPGGYLPVNPSTGNRYKGINAVHLMSQNREDNRWMTYKQAQGVGAQVKKGEKGTQVQFWKFNEEQTKKDDQGKPVLDNNGTALKVTVPLERPKVFFASVFNAGQIEGLKPLEKKELEWNPNERVENILKASGADIQHGGNRAFYKLGTDEIQLPKKEQFNGSSEYYSTALHELGHWTGHSDRLDRDLFHPFGSEGYAKEELRAEIFSLIKGDEFGVGHDPEQHVAYIDSWVKVLEEDSLEIFRAASDAEKISSYVDSLELQQVKKEENVESMVGDRADRKEFIDQVENERKNIEKAVTSEINTDSFSSSLTYLEVPYKEKEQAKELGAKWDRKEQSWYVPPSVDSSLFSKWEQRIDTDKKEVGKESKNNSLSEKVYLAVPYKEKEQAKELGAKWDKKAKSWYAGSNVDMVKVEKWLPKNVSNQQSPAMNPKEEFSDALRSIGAIVSGDHPVMDGSKQRIKVDGDKGSAKSGFYVGHLDGHPAGFMQNNKSGKELKWKSKGYSLSPEEKAKIQAESASKLKQRETDKESEQEKVSVAVGVLMSHAENATSDHGYLQKKNISPDGLKVVPADDRGLPGDSNILIAKNWIESKALREDNPEKLVFNAGDLLVPAQDIKGKLKTVQSIQENGTKIFAKGGGKQDAFAVVGGGGMEALESSSVIVISEGYATADTVSKALNEPTVVAFDSGNLANVARLIKDEHPDKAIVIAGDDDRHQEFTLGTNVGREKAEEAARLVGGKAVFPTFAPGENSWPTDVEPIDVNSFKKNNLSNEQKEALVKIKKFSDFKDVEINSVLGSKGVKRQLVSLVERIKSDIDILKEPEKIKIEKNELQKAMKQRESLKKEVEKLKYSDDAEGQGRLRELVSDSLPESKKRIDELKKQTKIKSATR